MRKKEYARHNSISDAFVFLVFGIFAICIIATLSLGISSYQKIVSRDDVTYRERTCAHYIFTKLEQAENLDRVYLDEMDGSQALVIEEEIDGDVYATKIYCYDGWLMECFSIPDSGVEADAGEKLVPAKSISASITDKLISIDVETPDGDIVSVNYSVYGRREVGL